MKQLITGILLLVVTTAFAQQQSYEMFTFNPPKGWKKQELENATVYSVTNEVKKSWCQLVLVKSTVSKGYAATDFESEWKQLVVDSYKEYGITDQPIEQESSTMNGWEVRSGMGKFLFNKDTATVALIMFSNGQRCGSVKIVSNSSSYGKEIGAFLESIQPENATAKAGEKVAPIVATTQPVPDGYTFTTTNFDDGWTSVVKEDWVEATKNNVKVLLHYPRPENSKYYSNREEERRLFWDLLVAPRYSNLRQFEDWPSNLPETAYFSGGLLTDNTTGKDVWVTLFSKGKSGWIEIITPDKNAFVQAFGIRDPHFYFTDWEPLLKLSGLNRFAVGEKDLAGKWSNEFQGSTNYYNLYTGLYTGSTTFASRQYFEFRANKSYNWDLVMANGASGTSMKVDNAKASGSWKLLNNWQVWLSEIERSQKTYNAYFSCFKGGRILWLQDISYGSYTAYGKISN